MCRMNLSHRPRDMEREGVENYWGFPLHCACWELLTTLRPWGVLDTKAIFDVCRSFPTKGMMGRSLLIDGLRERICRVERISRYSLSFYLGFRMSLKLHQDVYLGLYIFG